MPGRSLRPPGRRLTPEQTRVAGALSGQGWVTAAAAVELLALVDIDVDELDARRILANLRRKGYALRRADGAYEVIDAAAAWAAGQADPTT